MTERIDVERFERCLVHHCAPTLAGFKPACLFNYSCRFSGRDDDGMQSSASCDDNRQCLGRLVHDLQGRLESFGVRITVLIVRETGALIYVYRPERLAASIREDGPRGFLEDHGYDTSSVSACLKRLSLRIAFCDENRSSSEGKLTFPHEIGLFLGYPFDDVIGFIENEGRNFICCGCWKVYTDEDNARASFCRFHTCTTIYDTLYDKGLRIEDITCREDGSTSPYHAAIASAG
ncbi:MAG: DUF3793 family protein [Actinomycetota bacterium]|nr:DUF3793 family protein [Actinomycetota bacterium]